MTELDQLREERARLQKYRDDSVKIEVRLREENGRLRAAASVAKEALEATHHVAMYGNADAVREKVSKAINKLDAALTPQVASMKGDEKS